jgi:hypothetical protein
MGLDSLVGTALHIKPKVMDKIDIKSTRSSFYKLNPQKVKNSYRAPLSSFMTNVE